MNEDQNAAGAPGGDDTSALSMDDAVAALDAGDEKAKPEGGKGAPATELPEDEAPDDPAREAEQESEEDEPSEPDEGEGEPEEQDDDQEDVVHGNAKTRLRDGTVVAVADLKKSHAELQELKAKGSDIASERKALDETKAQLQARTKQLDEVLPHALRIAQSAIPAEPDEALMETDPIEYFSQQHKRAKAIAEFQQLENANRQTAAEQQAEAKRQAEEYVAKQQELLVAKLPELKDKVKAQAFYKDVLSHAEYYGFTKEEVEQAHDHRLWPLMKDAIRARKIDAAKPKVMEKARDAAPVQPAGRRPAPSERRNTEVSELSARLTRSGSIDDAAALLDKINP